MIQVENLSKTFELNRQQRKELGTDAKTVTAVDSISFTCAPGRVHALLGPNGAGKTTTLRMLATIFKPSSGSIVINHIDAVKQAQEARMQIGFLTGSAGLYARLTPNELLDYFAALYNVSKTDLDLDRKSVV